MPDIRIETQGTLAKVFVDGKEVGASAKGYMLTQRAGAMPTLHLFFNEEDMVDVGRVVELEKKVAELEEQVRAQPKGEIVEDLVVLMGKSVNDAANEETQQWAKIDFLDLAARAAKSRGEQCLVSHSRAVPECVGEVKEC